MFKKKKSEELRTLRHDMRGHVHTAKLNLDAAQAVAGKSKERMGRHLDIIREELDRIQRLFETTLKKLE